MCGDTSLKGTKMTLTEVLKLLEGKTLDASGIKTIMSEVDNIKAKAIKAEVDKFEIFKKEHETNIKELETFKTTQAETKAKEAFVKAGGDISKYDIFKKYAGKIEDVDKYDYKTLLNDIPNLKGNGGAGATPKPEGKTITSIHEMMAFAGSTNKQPEAKETPNDKVIIYG